LNSIVPEQILEEFLNRWPIEAVKEITLEEYVDTGNPDTFCQWVETKTKILGSIKGYPSIKFGIYKRKSPDSKPGKYINGEIYSWVNSEEFGETRSQAFNYVKSELIKTIQYADTGDFEKIDHINLHNLFKWKVAYLYSNERLVPIFKKAVLVKIAKHYGLKVKKNTPVSEIQNLMMMHKPSGLTVNQFMIELFNKFGNKKESDGNVNHNRIGRRSGTSSVSTASQRRSGTKSYITNQKHAKLQNKLKALLIKKYGETNVTLEENFVDIKVIQPECIDFYEVKSDSYASDCIKKALGQILLYVVRDEDHRTKNIYVVGQYPPNKSDKNFISFVKENLNLKFDYMNIDLSKSGE
jgi:hypothetical protein